ncbi:type III secretion system export apparatus subunit SctT [uncultured Thiothrix sp.]|jgi:type III secretion protein T|uniref:type III secretion system export apparatus subunit SctT n=1 Tax=uncultured Thiothrix sp. TaxID=223185 RepID=UPI00262D08BE|nr:type III secretion system export apparatus subunit SctT [uncultured Thiothrix sp.]HMT92187.1 type III secretion system export apparatus subunit SctT [Thiolinea sp.]
MIDVWHTWSLALILTAPRILVAFTVIPVFSQPIFPAMIRNGVMVIISLSLVPLTKEQLTGITLDIPMFALLIFKESVLGLLLGYAMSLPFWAARGAGLVMDMQRGAMAGMFFSPTLGNMVSPLGNLLGQLAITLVFTSGGFMLLLQTLMLSYQVWPLDKFFPDLTPETASFFVKQLDVLMYTTLLIAGPFIGIMLIIDIGTGLVGRYLPQLNIFLLSMPIKSALVFLILIVYIGIIGRYLHDSFLDFGANLNFLHRLVDGGK